MTITPIRFAAVSLLLLFCIPTTASALGLGFGAKAGYGSASANDVDHDLSALLLVANLELVAVAIEGNLGWHRTTNSDFDDTYRDEMSVVALAKFGLPIVPAILSLDFGAGLDQRFHLGTQVLGSDVDNVSGTRTFVPISAQLTGSVLLAKLYGEVRYNYEVANSIEVDGASQDYGNELLFLLGATF